MVAVFAPLIPLLTTAVVAALGAVVLGLLIWLLVAAARAAFVFPSAIWTRGVEVSYAAPALRVRISGLRMSAVAPLQPPTKSAAVKAMFAAF